MDHSRRSFALSLAALAAGSSLPRLASAAAPIRVGFLTVKSGALAAGGLQMEQGLRYFLQQNHNTIAGRPVQLFVADTAGQPALTKAKAQELVEKDKVQVIIGPLAAFEALAINDYIRQVQVPIISPSAAAEDLTQRKDNPWFVRAVGTSAQPMHPLGDYAAKTLKYKRIAIIADDFAFGYEVSAGFQRAFEDGGGEIVQKLWSPLNVADYGSYIGELDTKVDAVFAAFAGGNGIKFIKQYSDYGLKGKIPLLGSMTTVDEGVLPAMGDDALGIISGGWYTAELDNPYNKAFVAGIEHDYHRMPGYYTVGAYGAALMLKHALETVHGDIENRDAFMHALRHVVVPDDPRGPIRLDDLGNPIMNVYIRKVERKNGQLVNAVLKTYPNVSQFWTYGEKAFLAEPVYSRDYPPARFLGR